MSPPDICISWSVLSFLGTDPLAQLEVAPQSPHYFWRRPQHFHCWWELLHPIILWGFIKNLLRWTTIYQVYRDAGAHYMPHTRSCSAQTRAWPWSTMPLCLVAFSKLSEPASWLLSSLCFSCRRFSRTTHTAAGHNWARDLRDVCTSKMLRVVSWVLKGRPVHSDGWPELNFVLFCLQADFYRK
jgi:hypothetical protein